MDQGDNENIQYIEQFFEDQRYNDSISGSTHNLNEDYIITPLNVEKNNNNISASASSSNRYSPYSPHPKYGVYKPMEWTSRTTNDGRFIMTDAKVNNGHLSDEAQNSLTKLLINYLFQDKSRGTDFYFRKIASLIIEIFPKEQEKLYFIPSSSGNNSHAKGKLVERWKNVSRRLRSIGAIEGERKTKCANDISPAVITFSDEIEAAKVWLSKSGSSSDFDEVIKHWKLTYDIRKTEIHGSDISKRHLSEIFKSWPILCGPKGYVLVFEDFNLEYPIIKNLLHDWPTFIKKWTYFSNNLLSLRRNSVKDNYGKDILKQLDAVQLSGNTRTCNILKLLLIPYLVPTKTQIKNNKKSWKPSLVESAAAFVVHVTNLTGLEAELDKRIQKYIQYGTTIQPFIVLVGKDIFSIKYCYIRVDDQFWTFDCPLEAVDACFKTYMALHCCYPKECYESWIILQLQLYNLETIYDRQSSVIVSLNSKMNTMNETVSI
ncbi:uncharacterized protein LOC132934573 isoform X3 [Metopolophium dirhodum]|uniref:uncharacterized protein LOC132934573 isoform X3 n=1 Tax=Metopolophium dirhodum TaxID=44670 RepID=UPI00298F6B79|nr:uncharacterized protein LOC132934573 isoform X3 [Metopolophium dirhodum]